MYTILATGYSLNNEAHLLANILR
ncbi:hypothetical protein DSUL_20520 [Desulfovibrionales bacterium]